MAKILDFKDRKEFMAYVRSQKKNNNGNMTKKKGKGILSDIGKNVKNFAIDEGEKLIKKKASDLVDKGVNMAVKKIRGKGIFSDIGKTVFKTGLDIVPIPNLARKIVEPVGELVIDKTLRGKGMTNKLVSKKTVVKNNMAKGGALKPLGGALLPM